MAKRGADGGKRTLVMQGLLPFGFVAAHKTMELTAQAGPILVAETLMALRMEAVVMAELRLRRRRRRLSEYDSPQAIVLLDQLGVADPSILCGIGTLLPPPEDAVPPPGRPRPSALLWLP